MAASRSIKRACRGVCKRRIGISARDGIFWDCVSEEGELREELCAVGEQGAELGEGHLCGFDSAVRDGSMLERSLGGLKSGRVLKYGMFLLLSFVGS